MDHLTIGSIATRANLQPSTIRYYEEIGVLPDPRRINGRRTYFASVVERLTLIRIAQKAGYTLAEIRELINGFAEDAPSSERWQSFAEQKLREADALVARAEQIRALVKKGQECECSTLDECARRWEDENTSVLEKPIGGSGNLAIDGSSR